MNTEPNGVKMEFSLRIYLLYLKARRLFFLRVVELDIVCHLKSRIALFGVMWKVL